ncbi:hypothetical protein BH11GEM1_BH11GEM1_12240 [soil metagenome]
MEPDIPADKRLERRLIRRGAELLLRLGRRDGAVHRVRERGDEGAALASEDGLVFREYHALLEYKLQRREELDRQIEQLALLPSLAPMVQTLQCFRGISFHSAMVLATEIGDWRRFEYPRQLACYLGLVPKEDSSGDRIRLGAITKAGTRIVAMSSSRRRGVIGTGRKPAWT